jgi:hypothetical protein
MPKTYSQLIPSIDRRLSAWISILEKKSSREESIIRPTITISRQYGCQGYPLAESLKQILEERTGEVWNIYDKALLEKVSADEQLSLKLLQKLGGPSRFWDNLPITIPGQLPHTHMYRKVAKHIINIAEIGCAIILGRGGAIITQKLPNCYHFFLEASFEFRAASMGERLMLPLDEAKKHVKENQGARDKFYSECLNTSLNDHSYYDAIYNNERHSVAEIAWSIIAYVMRDWQEKGGLGGFRL